MLKYEAEAIAGDSCIGPASGRPPHQQCGMERLRRWRHLEWSPCCREVRSPQFGTCGGSTERGGRLPKATGALGSFRAPISRIWNHSRWPDCFHSNRVDRWQSTGPWNSDRGGGHRGTSGA